MQSYELAMLQFALCVRQDSQLNEVAAASLDRVGRGEFVAPTNGGRFDPRQIDRCPLAGGDAFDIFPLRLQATDSHALARGQELQRVAHTRGAAPDSARDNRTLSFR